ncbi:MULTISPECIES: helix-turn-helix transcriptional regulator [unclassified Streptomyces]|uniref:helix-turn-helix transcriptional regulator n=1 Tax=unclassified Streptomyces TaxID=2593676 RepID=UPI002E15002C|nr:helix-turn-helix transcriptional regulator [Streptomyces sp. NBC_01205]
MPDNQLGEFLRARRAGLHPQDVALPTHGMRRVSGLRREEVAVLVGMNADYYTRLEQGRERRPSAQLLDALARALRLDPDAHAHLHRLAGTTPPRPLTPTPLDQTSPALRQLLDGFPGAPVFVINRALDLLATNALAEALYSPFEPADNLARMVFLDSAGPRFHTRWLHTARAVVGHLRQAAGLDPDNSRLHGLVRDLDEHSADFSRLWNTHTVRGKTSDAKDFHHPDVGPLTLRSQTFDVREAPGQQLVVYQAEPASPSSEALTLLGTLHATTRWR